MRFAPFLLLVSAFLVRCSAVPPPEPPTEQILISLSPSITEILFAIGAGSDLRGVCRPNDHPPEAAAIAAVASHQMVDVEAIVGLNPSAVFTCEGMQSPEVLATIERFGIPVHVYPTRSIEDLWACMRDVGLRTGRTEQAAALAEACMRRLGAAQPRDGMEALSAVLIVGTHPLVAAGEGTFLDEVLHASGFTNAAPPHAGYQAMSMETLAAADPDCLILPRGDLPPDDGARLARDLEHLTGHEVPCVWVDADRLSRPGPRTPEAVEELARKRGRLLSGESGNRGTARRKAL